MSVIKVLLAEDHTIVRKGLCSILADESDIEVVGEAENGRDALEKVERLQPDVVLMDISMPVLNGLEATRRIKKQFPDIKILILTMYTNEEYLLQILRSGASGYLLKQGAVNELVTAIRSAYEGASFFSPAIPKPQIEDYRRQIAEATERDPYDKLTGREREIFQLVAEGRSNQEIAQLLCISGRTARAHRRHLMDKLDLHSIAELTQYALRKGVIIPDEGFFKKDEG